MTSDPNFSDSKLELVRHQSEEIRSIMADNMHKAISRGEKLDVLNDKAEDLSRHARLFHNESRRQDDDVHKKREKNRMFGDHIVGSYRNYYRNIIFHEIINHIK